MISCSESGVDLQSGELPFNGTYYLHKLNTKEIHFVSEKIFGKLTMNGLAVDIECLG